MMPAWFCLTIGDNTKIVSKPSTHNWAFSAKLHARSFDRCSSTLACGWVKEAVSGIGTGAKMNSLHGAEDAVRFIEKRSLVSCLLYTHHTC